MEKRDHSKDTISCSNNDAKKENEVKVKSKGRLYNFSNKPEKQDNRRNSLTKSNISSSCCNSYCGLCIGKDASIRSYKNKKPGIKNTNQIIAYDERLKTDSDCLASINTKLAASTNCFLFPSEILSKTTLKDDRSTTAHSSNYMLPYTIKETSNNPNAFKIPLDVDNNSINENYNFALNLHENDNFNQRLDLQSIKSSSDKEYLKLLMRKRQILTGNNHSERENSLISSPIEYMKVDSFYLKNNHYNNEYSYNCDEFLTSNKDFEND